MGMPGFSGFPAELTILIGTWKTSPLWATFAAAGVLVAAAFTLRVIQISFFGTSDRESSPPSAQPARASAAAFGIVASPLVSFRTAEKTHSHHCPPITWPERLGALILIAATAYIGLKPDALLNWITPALQSPVMQAVLKGGAS
jgi:NADH-quinone oxidoreductase subunit M